MLLSSSKFVHYAIAFLTHEQFCPSANPVLHFRFPANTVIHNNRKTLARFTLRPNHRLGMFSVFLIVTSLLTLAVGNVNTPREDFITPSLSFNMPAAPVVTIEPGLEIAPSLPTMVSGWASWDPVPTTLVAEFTPVHATTTMSADSATTSVAQAVLDPRSNLGLFVVMIVFGLFVVLALLGTAFFIYRKYGRAKKGGKDPEVVETYTLRDVDGQVGGGAGHHYQPPPVMPMAAASAPARQT
ncbi:hypothetical protein K504DRAFT_487686 [Pleomassaria siparia CBS 279.74]|uniref:Uncharacterized protein n=1 Tax=Pleomassaria siparia CBS 279.74 TaxID=1314801 RepID=A0A6G1KLI1_9PLEO|nr:hypothetical protein K504DRAFT_487686 [Pleomassaria siparia CBS 279.74]